MGVARALASDPDLILMDEPFGALDPITRRELQDEFRALQRRLGKTVIVVTHDIREACRIADRLALMDRGRLVQYGTATELMEQPATDFVRSFFAEAEAVVPAGRGAAMTDFLQLARDERWGVAAATAAHLDLVLEALLIAVVVGVPLGILAVRSRGTERVVLGLANILQTVPSLALLGFLLIVFRGSIGKPPALAALVIYSLLPIIKNTILGLRGIDPGVVEAAVGMGMTAWQRLVLVELPLAVPIILGGVRVATVSAIGMATIAAAIGAKGLGGYIFRGVSLSDTRLLLLCSVPAALLALACDAALGEIERALDPTRSRPSKVRTTVASLAIFAPARHDRGAGGRGSTGRRERGIESSSGRRMARR